MPSTTQVRTGARVLADDPSLLPPGRYALVTNFTGVMEDLSRDVDALVGVGIEITVLLGPEHGLHGSAQAGQTEQSSTDEATGLPVTEIYGVHGADLQALIASLDVDGLLFDMQDVGTRYYTYVATMIDTMICAARLDLRYVVLDRPNPLGGEVAAGPGLLPGFESGVGRIDVRQRHGLTVGEIARLANGRDVPAAVGHEARLQVVAMQGWSRSMYAVDTGLPWVPPSPNIPTPDSALAFSGTGLFEGTNVTEGRGTTRPFETLGAPWIDGAFATSLRMLDLPGLLVRETWFTPTFHKYQGRTVRGIQLHVTDARAADPVSFALHALHLAARLYPDRFSTERRDGDGILGRQIGRLDVLWGSSSLREALADGTDPLDLAPAPAHPGEVYPDGVLLYS
jgi:uncharacterized protein YbbC (DUF1343 family)